MSSLIAYEAIKPVILLAAAFAACISGYFLISRGGRRVFRLAGMLLAFAGPFGLLIGWGLWI